jgi:hypothetical protein
MSERPVPHHTPDSQRLAVYAWERDFVEKAIGDEIMGRDACENLVRSASGFLGMRAPRIVYTKIEGAPCRAVPDTHELHIATWGRGHVTLLHEVGHLDTWPTVMRGEAAHGPTFLGCVMGLYARFLRIPLPHLVSTARMRNLDFLPPMGPALALPPDR